MPESTANATTDETLVGPGSIMYVPTGLFVSGGAQKRDRDGVDGAGDDLTAYHGEAGIERKWFGIGATTFYGEYGITDFDREIPGVTGAIHDSTYWGLGLVQKIDATATDLHLNYRQYEATNLANLPRTGDNDASVFMAGMRIAF